ncbi:MAG: alanine racemase [Gammaproteobacteria bacterium]|nr:alanine racemase [Gammaproteobacteria bacterium]
MSRILRACIDRAALRANLAAVRAAAPGSKVMAVVKANAYGHGLVATASTLSGADAFSVARIEEGVLLREAGLTHPIVLLEGVFSGAQLAEAAHRDFELVVHDPSQVALLEAQGRGRRFVVWIKVDTGMNRLGFRPEDFPAALARLCALPVPPREIRLLTHLARADERDCPMTGEQVARLQSLLDALPPHPSFAGPAGRPVLSIGNSAGLLGWPAARGDWVRPGLALYGVSPFPGEVGAALGLVPAMTLESSVIAVRRVPRGETVGYGGTWRAERDSDVAILAAGYGDGVPRHLTSGAPVQFPSGQGMLAGRVSMDMIAVDVTGLPGVRVGERAVLWGATLPVERVAEYAGTIPYELICGVSQRVPLELK